MSFAPNVWYTDSTQYANVAAWTASHSYAAGALVRQLAVPTVGNERVFVCIIAGTSLVSEPSWTVTKGATTAESAGPTWQECTGQPGVNSDISTTSTSAWAASTAANKGQIIYDSVSAALQIVSSANGTTKSGSAPIFSATAGVTTTDNTLTWTSLGAATNFTKWAAPHAREINAFAINWGVAGNKFYVGDDSASTQAALLTFTPPGTAAAPCYIQCIDHTANLPPTASNLNTGASITVTGANNFNVASTFNYIQGFTLVSGNSGNASSLAFQNQNGYVEYLNCSFIIGTINAGSLIRSLLGASVLINTTMTFGATTQSFSPAGPYCKWTNTTSAIQGATIPTSFITASSYLIMSGVDLSAIGSGSSLVNLASTTYSNVLINNCKINASVSLTTGSVVGPGGCQLTINNVDSGATNYKYLKQWYQGTITQEIVVVKSGGSSDGTTLQSSKMVSSANNTFIFPLESDPISIWTDATSAHTITISVITDNVTLQNTDAWIEVEYLGSSSSPISSFTNCRATTVLTSGSAQPTDSVSSWTTTGLTTPVKQSLSVSVTPGMKGPILIRVYLAKPSTTMWFDGIPVLS